MEDVDYALYTITAEATNYLPLEYTSVEVWSDTSIQLMMVRDYQLVGIKVINRADHAPVYRAGILSGGKTLLTNSSGEAVVDNALKGYWHYAISHEDYFPYEDSLRISKDTSIIVALTRTTASLTFFVKHGELAVPGATIRLHTGILQYSDADGRVLFFNQQARKKYAYEIIKEGYQPVSDSLFLEIDTIIEVQLMLADSYREIDHTILVYPNPAEEKLFVEIEAGDADLRIISMEGKLFRIQQIFPGRNSIDVSGMPAGLYYLHVHNESFSKHWKIVIQNRVNHQ